VYLLLRPAGALIRGELTGTMPPTLWEQGWALLREPMLPGSSTFTQVLPAFIKVCSYLLLHLLGALILVLEINPTFNADFVAGTNSGAWSLCSWVVNICQNYFPHYPGVYLLLHLLVALVVRHVCMYVDVLNHGHPQGHWLNSRILFLKSVVITTQLGLCFCILKVCALGPHTSRHSQSWQC
jgi:hypothetical protein